MAGHHTTPTVFHITHWKAGSQWVAEILKYSAMQRFVAPKVGIAHFFQSSIIPGAIYPTVYVPYQNFKSALFPEWSSVFTSKDRSANRVVRFKNWYNFRFREQPVIKFFVIRDLRDAMVSLYFSLKVSHPVIAENISHDRQFLREKDFEEGFIHLLNTRAYKSALIQTSWFLACEKGEALLVRYEDLIAKEQEEFAKIIEYCRIDISSEKLSHIVGNNSFHLKSGRSPGDEDVSSHYRKGISGDWRNYFTNRIKDEFKQRFGQVLIDTGYEKDLSW